MRKKTARMRAIERATGQDIVSLLRKRYVHEGLSQEAIARELGVSISTIWLWLFKFGIPARQWQHPEAGSDSG